MRARFKYWQDHHYSQNRCADLFQSTDRLLSVAKSAPALSLTELLSIKDGIFTVAGACP